MSMEWITDPFRQRIIHKIDEQMQQLPAPIGRTASDMEAHVFAKAKSKDEYLTFVAKLMSFIKTKFNPNNGPVQKRMQDPIGALQSLARQGTSNNNNLGIQGPGQNLPNMGQQVGQNQNVATNLLQTLNQQRPGQTINIQQAMHNKMSGMTMLQNQQMNMNQMNQMQNMQNNPMMSQINQMNQGLMPVAPQQMGPQPGQQQQQQMGGPQMGPNQVQQVIQNQMQNQMINHQMSGPMNPGVQSTLQSQPSPSQQQQQQHVNQMNAMNQMQQQQLHMQRKPEMINTAYSAQRNITPNQFLRQSPSPSAPSPSGLGAPGSNQMVPSPALVPSPNPQLLGGPRTMAMAPSPSSSLNTPAGMLGGAVPSPIQDDQISQACKEKIQKLRKYIDPLNKMILKLTNDGQSEKIMKMKKLLELLTNPNSITKLDVLQKCEIVLEKMDFKKYDSTTGPTISANLKEHQFLTPLLEVVSTLLQSPSPNHTLYRTFGPCVEALNGPEIKNLPPPLKKRKTEEAPCEIPDVLQGEIARLDQRFKISLDPAQQNGSKCIQLICWLDDKHLPCVPPVLVIVPTDYPTVPPKCVLTSHEYATPYLSSVQRGLDARLAKLPKRFSISQLLDNWEMSVRQACAPKAQKEQKAIEDASRAGKGSSILSSTIVNTSSSLVNGIPMNLIDSVAS